MKSNVKPSPVFEEGIFTPLVVDFLHYKRACGVKYFDSAEYTLRAICKALNQYPADRPELTREMVTELVKKRPQECYSTQSKRITYLRQFALYLSMRGFPAYLYPEQGFHKGEKTFVPYLFRDDELEKIFNAAKQLRPICRYPHYQEVYPVLLRLLYSSGLRLSETLNLKISHFCQENGTLLIEKSKNGKSRCVPLSVSMSSVLSKYISKRFSDAPDAKRYIFEAPDGGAYNRGSVRATIINLFKAAGLPGVSDGHHPRVHDARHLFAVKAMEKMKAEGMDLYCALPVLSAYLGHKGIRETEKYLWLPQFRMDEIAASDQHLIPGMIPEVTWDED